MDREARSASRRFRAWWVVRTLSAPYDVAKNWPADISTVPGNEQWTWGAGQGIYAENPDRVFLLFRGELPNIKRPRPNCCLISGRAFVSHRPVTVAGRDSRRPAGSRRDGPGPR